MKPTLRQTAVAIVEKAQLADCLSSNKHVGEEFRVTLVVVYVPNPDLFTSAHAVDEKGEVSVLTIGRLPVANFYLLPNHRTLRSRPSAELHP